VNPRHGGRDCDALEQSRSCKMRLCPVDCQLGAWQAWGACSKSCGFGTQQRKRLVIVQGASGGMPCTHTLEVQNCQETQCPVHCLESEWSDYSACSRSCGQGSQHRSRTVLVAAQYGGLPCKHLAEAKVCQEAHCPIHCALHPWGDWSKCSKTCGLGVQVRARSVLTSADHGGNGCDATRKTQECDAGLCPEDCVVGPWDAFGACDATCGASKRTSVRRVLKVAEDGGLPCPNLERTEACIKPSCPVHCEVGGWGQYTPCTKSCGFGEKRRQRTVVKQAAHGGDDCPELVEQTACHERDCPVDCEMTDWSAWTSCHATYTSICAQKRTRQVKSVAVNGGKECPASVVWRNCVSDVCRVPASTGCKSVRCTYVQDDLGRGHVRVFHDKSEPMGMRHTCRKLTHFHKDVTTAGQKVNNLHEHGTYENRCDCICSHGAHGELKRTADHHKVDMRVSERRYNEAAKKKRVDKLEMVPMNEAA
jgi:hypothetical protein